MDRNFILAIVFSTLIVLFFSSPFYQNRFGHELPPETVTLSDSTKTAGSDAPTVPAATTPATLGDSTALIQSQTDSTIAAVDSTYIPIAMAPDTVLSIENEDLIISIATRGGALVQAVTRKFDGTSPEAPAALVLDGQTWYDGILVEAGRTLAFDSLVFTAETPDAQTLLLRAAFPGGRSILRSYHLDPTGYVVTVATTLEGVWNDPELSFTWHGPLADTEEPVKQLRIWPFSMMMRDDATLYNKAAYLALGDRTNLRQGNSKGSETERVYADKVQMLDVGKGKYAVTDTFTGDLSWYAVKNKYFMAATLPTEPSRWNAEASYSLANGVKWYEYTLKKRVTDGDTGLSIYLGPLSYDTLNATDKSLTKAMELSWKFIRPISIGFLWIMKHLHMVIPNWGLVIIVFAIIVKVLLHPLAHSSNVSMKKMAALQPRIAELREKHATNPQKLNQATMELYRSEGVNPFGGCLPVLLQMPVFFALYPVVGRAFELRQAAFINGWLGDLSRPDPFYILPIAMGISMFFQSRETMTDPSQKGMLYIMPVMMVVLFANFSAGLTLYWLVFNILSFLHQKLLT